MSNPFDKNEGITNSKDPIRYPNLLQKSNINNPLIMFNECKLPNYTNPQNQKIMHGNSSLIIINNGETNTNNNTNNTNNTNNNKINKNTFSLNHNGKASSISTSFNIMKGIIGISLLTLPWSIANIGLLPALILISISFILSYVTWIFLCLLSSQYSVYAYRDIGAVIFGSSFATLLDLILLIFCYLSCLLYCIFLSEFLSVALMQFNIQIDDDISFSNLYLIQSVKHFLSTTFFVITISIFCILFPLSLLPTLDSLKYSSFLGMIACFYIIGLIVFTLFDEKDKNGYYVSHSVHFSLNYTSFKFWLFSFNIFVTCFNTHFNGPALYGELKNKSTAKFINVSSVSFFFVLFLNFVIGICGYFIFGSQCNENILNGLNHDIVVSIAQLIMALVIIAIYPLLFWNIKVSIDNLCLYKNITNINHTKIKKIKRKYTCVCSKVFLYFVITFTIWIIAILASHYIIAILYVVQSLLANVIVFIFPAIFYFQMMKNEQFIANKNRYNIKVVLLTILCYVVVIFGVICVIGDCTAAVMFWLDYIQ